MLSSSDLRKQLETQQALTGTPGIAMGILQDGEVVTAACGVTNVDHPLGITDETLFQIGSVTKTMTATVAMRLVDQGKLDLDAPVRQYLPDFQLEDEATAATVTVRHLFIHTAGWIGDYFEDTGNGDDGLARYVANMAMLPQQAPLGEIWSYNNAAFSLAGRVIEVVTGQPYEAAMQERLFDPLGMEMTFLHPSDVMTHRFVVGHKPDAPVSDTAKDTVDETVGMAVAKPWPLARSANPAGGVVSTIRDMLCYAQFHMVGGRSSTGEELLTPESAAEMQRIQAEAGTMASHVGISWMLNDVDGVRTVGHGGATNGQIAQLLLVPERAFAFIILTNASRGREVTRDLTAWVLASALQLRPEKPKPVALSPDAITEYIGHYSAQLSDIEVSTVDRNLQLQIIPTGGFPDKDTPADPPPPPITGALFAQDRLIITAGASRDSLGEFIRDDNGVIAWLRFGGRIHKRQG